MLPIDDTTLRGVAQFYSNKTRNATQATVIGAIGPRLKDVLQGYKIDTMLRIAHFLAQVCKECADFTELEEAIKESDAEENYRGINGNDRPGDGYNFRGRGLIQLTGRGNYLEYGKKLGLDLISHPERASDPETALRIACEFWVAHGLSDLADEDLGCAITHRVNGGLNGIEYRLAYLSKAKTLLLPLARQLGVATEPLDGPVLRPGMTSISVYDLQYLLDPVGNELGRDGVFGPGLEKAVRSFQTAHHLPVDGVVGPNTWKVLRARGS